MISAIQKAAQAAFFIMRAEPKAASTLRRKRQSKTSIINPLRASVAGSFFLPISLYN